MYAEHLETGKQAEQIATAYLRSLGMELLVSNYRCYHGEIDLIMRDRDDIVFVEVRCRNRQDYGTASESVNRAKQAKLIKAATHFLQYKQWLYKVSSRFDVIAVHHTINEPNIEWFKNAFMVERR